MKPSSVVQTMLKIGSRRSVESVRGMLGAIGVALVLTGCATSGNPKDPIEGFNRAMFAINDGVDQAVIRPVAVGYDTVMPSPLKKGVTNFFGNIADLFIGVNNLLQGKVSNGVSDFGRVLVNSTVGLLGLIDVASDIGMEKHNEDFGQTFGRWGIDSGAYVVLPLLGPSTVRDTVGLIADSKTNPVPHIDDVSVRNSLLALSLIDKRASFLAADKVVEAAALDKYSYIRDAHLQRRRNLLFDGNPPRERDDSASTFDVDVGHDTTLAQHTDADLSIGEVATTAYK